VDGEKPGGGDTLASFSAAVEGANPRGGGGCVLSLINKLWDVEFLAL
jgi:hypothetical protein